MRPWATGWTPGFEHLIPHAPMRRSARDVLSRAWDVLSRARDVLSRARDVLSRARGEHHAGHRPGDDDDDLEDRREPPLLPSNNAIRRVG